MWPSDLLRGVRNAGDDGAIGVGDEDAARALRRPGRQRALDVIGGAADIGAQIAARAVDLDRDLVGQRPDGLPLVHHRLAALLEHLHAGADRNGDQKGDDQNRHRAAQQRLGAQEAVIRRLGDRLRQPLDRIRAYRRTRRLGARHIEPPFRNVPCT